MDLFSLNLLPSRQNGKFTVIGIAKAIQDPFFGRAMVYSVASVCRHSVTLTFPYTYTRNLKVSNDTSTTASFQLVISFLTSFQPTCLHCYFTFFINQ